jgi:hypothetical protein
MSQAFMIVIGKQYYVPQPSKIHGCCTRHARRAYVFTYNYYADLKMKPETSKVRHPYKIPFSRI